MSAAAGQATRIARRHGVVANLDEVERRARVPALRAEPRAVSRDAIDATTARRRLRLCTTAPDRLEVSLETKGRLAVRHALLDAFRTAGQPRLLRALLRALL